MKSIYWKELRENVKWAALGLLLFTAELVFAWVTLLRDEQTRSWGGSLYQSICHPAFQAILLFTPVIFAGILAAIQIKLELSRDRWAFLVHRPVTLATIFWGKALAGMTLYLPTVLIPFIGLCLWVATPGHCPGPFHWGMSISGFINILCGLVAYFLILMAQMRPSRLIGSRILPHLAGVYLLRFVWDCRDWPPALTWTLVAIAVAVLAALGAFTWFDRTIRLRWLLSAAIIAVLFAGFSEALRWPFEILRLTASANHDFDYHQYAVLEEGKIIKIRNQNYQQTFYDLDGNVLASGQDQIEKMSLHTVSFYGLSRKETYTLRTSLPYRDAQHWIGRPQDMAMGRQLWFYEARHGYFVRYNLSNFLPNGYLSRAGFTESSPTAADLFSGTFWSENWWYMHQIVGFFDKEVYWIDTRNTLTRKLYSADNPKDLTGFIFVTGRNLENDQDKVIAVVTRTAPAIHVMDIAGQPLFSAPWHKDRAIYQEVMIAFNRTTNHYYFQYEAFNVDNWDKKPLYIVETDGTGKLLKETELPPRNRPHYGKSWRDVVNAQAQYVQSNFAFKVWDLAALWWKARQGNKDAQAWWKWNLRHPVKALTDPAICLGIGMLCATLGWWRMRRYSFPASRQRNWMLFVLLTGPIGLLTLLAQETWPVSEPCPACGKRRLITFDQCEHCGAAWSAPAKDGTELITI